jgi:carotenoid 1,2-hydratase
LDHCALNVALYGPNGGMAWTLTEGAMLPTSRGANHAQFGESRIEVARDRVTVHVRERAPWTGRWVEGEVVLEREAEGLATPWKIDPEQQHQWWLVMPRARMRARFDAPKVHFHGTAYHDANMGRVSLEDSFSRWSWGRAHSESGATVVTYDVLDRAHQRRSRAVRVDRRGNAQMIEDLERVAFPASRWGVACDTLVDRSAPEVKLVKRLEDTPFYVRSLLSAQLGGERVTTMYEQLSLERFDTRWVQHLLGYRMSKRGEAA